MFAASSRPHSEEEDEEDDGDYGPDEDDYKKVKTPSSSLSNANISIKIISTKNTALKPDMFNGWDLFLQNFGLHFSNS